jgi:hypothetical protein
MSRFSDLDIMKTQIIIIEDISKNCLSTRVVCYAPILILEILQVFLRVRMLACVVLGPISRFFEIPLNIRLHFCC